VIVSFLLAITMFAVPAAADVKPADFEQYIVSKLLDYETGMIDIERFVDKYGWDKDDLANAVYDVFTTHPELFYVEFAFNSYGVGKKITGIKFQYLISKSRIAAKQKELDDAAKKAVAGITPDMSDVDKALYVHDYLILNCKYDFSKNNYYAYNCLVDGTCVCQGYSLAYVYILTKYLGMECTVAYSTSQDHMWNYVKIGKNWYHVDVTADEINDTNGLSSYDRYGGIHHDNFLMSDKKCRESSGLHRDWRIAGYDVSASDTSYDNAFWNGIDSALCYDSGNYYYVHDGGSSKNDRIVEIRRYNIASQTSSVLAKMKSRWYRIRSGADLKVVEYGKEVYTDIYSCIALKDGKLYINSNKSVYSYNLATKAVKKVFTLNKGESMQIFGMVLVGDKLRIAYRPDRTYQETYMKLVFG
jgi:hypothetical protein